MNNEHNSKEVREELSGLLRQEMDEQASERTLRALELHRDLTHRQADAASRRIWSSKPEVVWWQRWQYPALGAGLAAATIIMIVWFGGGSNAVPTSEISIDEAAAYLETPNTSLQLDEEILDETETDLLIATLSAADDASADWILTTNDVNPLFSEYNDGN